MLRSYQNFSKLNSLQKQKTFLTETRKNLDDVFLKTENFEDQKIFKKVSINQKPVQELNENDSSFQILEKSENLDVVEK